MLIYPRPTPIYHFTHINNLPSIFSTNGLTCHVTLQSEGQNYVSVAHKAIQDRRATTQVPNGEEGVLHDYVPFYFAPRSPMLYAIKMGNVEGYSEGQEPVVYVVSTVERVRTSNVPFVFTDGHAVMEMSEFYTDIEDLGLIDWRVMLGTDWYDTPSDNDRKRRRQAEFLVHRFFACSLITEIGVMNSRMQSKVNTILLGETRSLPVTVHRDWYY